MGIEGWTKVPIQCGAGSPAPARVNDLSTWGSYEDAVARVVAGQADGICFNLYEADIGAIDLDNCYKWDTKAIAPWAQEIIDRAPKDVYVEISVSGTGLHMLGTAIGPRLDTNAAMPDGGRLELYRNTPRALSISGLAIRGADGVDGSGEMANLDAFLDELATEFARRKATVQAERGRLREGKWARGAMHEDLHEMIASGAAEPTRSQKFFAAVAWLKRLDWSIDGIVDLLELWPDGIGAKYKGRLRKEVERAFDKVELTGVNYGDFFAYAPSQFYMYAPANRPWPGTSVNARLPQTALLNRDGSFKTTGEGNKKKPVKCMPTDWLDKNRSVEEMTWAPGLPLLVHDKLMVEHGWVDRPGVTTYNQYIPPIEQDGDPRKALPWLKLVYKVYPGEARRIILWFAHRVQKPQEKPNFGIVMGGAPGIGKDTILEAVRRAVGAWNFQDVAPHEMFGTFNGFNKAVILRVNETRDLGETTQFAFYDRMKTYLASPPEGLPTNEKFIKRYTVANVCGAVYTTNYRETGLYLPVDDRRHYVAWSELTQAYFPDGFWKKFWSWYHSGGFGHVGAFLRQLDISEFKAQEPPPKTEAFWAIVNANRAVEENELNDVLDQMGKPRQLTGQPERPHAVTLLQLLAQKGLPPELDAWLRDRKNRRVIPKHMRAAGYECVANPDADDGLWRINKKRQAIYARADLSLEERLAAANKLKDAK